jgi:hypothetical protein
MTELFIYVFAFHSPVYSPRIPNLRIRIRGALFSESIAWRSSQEVVGSWGSIGLSVRRAGHGVIANIYSPARLLSASH